MSEPAPLDKDEIGDAGSEVAAWKVVRRSARIIDNSEVLYFRNTLLKEPHRVGEADAAADFGSAVLDERKMVAVQTVVQVEGVDAEDVHHVPAGERVGCVDVEDGVAGGAGFGGEQTVLLVGQAKERLDAESAFAVVHADSASKRRDAGHGNAALRRMEFRVDVVRAEVEP